jgi:N-methylhydantoinase A/oxoprolinase/acetone carboxylase beta subunit
MKQLAGRKVVFTLAAGGREYVHVAGEGPGRVGQLPAALVQAPAQYNQVYIVDFNVDEDILTRP